MKIKKIKLAGDKARIRLLSMSREKTIKKILRTGAGKHISEHGLQAWSKTKKHKTSEIKIGDVVRFHWIADRTFPYYYKWKIGRYIRETKTAFNIKIIFLNSIITDSLDKKKYTIEKAIKKEREAYEMVEKMVENMILAKEVAEKL
jgi:hypothetical protein